MSDDIHMVQQLGSEYNLGGGDIFSAYRKTNHKGVLKDNFLNLYFNQDLKTVATANFNHSF